MGGMYTSEAGVSAYLPQMTATCGVSRPATAATTSSKNYYSSGGDYGYGAPSATIGPQQQVYDGLYGLEEAAAAGDGHAARRLESLENAHRHRKVKAMLVPRRPDGTKSLYPAAVNAVALRADCAALNGRTDLLAAAFTARMRAARRRCARLDAESDAHVGTAPRIAWSTEELRRLEMESLKLRIDDLVRGGYDHEDARMHAGAYRTLAEQRSEGLDALKRVVGGMGAVVGPVPSWRGAGAAGQAGVGVSAVQPHKARSISNLAKKKTAEMNTPRLTLHGLLKLEKPADRLRKKVNEITKGALGRLKHKSANEEMEMKMDESNGQRPQSRPKSVRFNVKEMVESAVVAQTEEEMQWEAAGGDEMVAELRAQCAALLSGESPADVGGALRLRTLDHLHAGQRLDVASLRVLQRQGITKRLPERTDPTMAHSVQPSASLTVSLLEERMKAAQRAWWLSEQWEKEWKEQRAILEASEARCLAARDLARELESLEAEIASLRKENYQLRTAARESMHLHTGVSGVGSDNDGDDAIFDADASSPASSPSHSSRRRQAVDSDWSSNHPSGMSSRSRSPESVEPPTFIGAIQRISVGGERILGNALKSSGLIDEDSDEETGQVHGHARTPALTAAQRRTKQVRKLADMWFQNGPSKTATEILAYELITAGEALSILPTKFVAEIIGLMPVAAAAAVFSILMPLSLRGEVLAELNEDTRREILARCGGAGLGGVSPEVVATMIDSLDSASIADWLGDLGASDAASVLVGLLRGRDGTGGLQGGARAASTIASMDIHAAARAVACMPPESAALAFNAMPTHAATAVVRKIESVDVIAKLATHMDVAAAGRMLATTSRNALVLRTMHHTAAGAVAAAMSTSVAAAALSSLDIQDAALIVRAMNTAAAGAILGDMTSSIIASSILKILESRWVAEVLESVSVDTAGALLGALILSSPQTTDVHPRALDGPTMVDDAESSTKAAKILGHMDAESSVAVLNSVAVTEPAAATMVLSRMSAPNAGWHIMCLASSTPGPVGTVLTALTPKCVSTVLTHMSPEEVGDVLHRVTSDHVAEVLNSVMAVSAADLIAERKAADEAVRSRSPRFPTPSAEEVRDDNEDEKAEEDDEQEKEQEKEEQKQEDDELPDFTGYPAAETVASIMAQLESNVAAAVLRALPPSAAAALIFASVTSDTFRLQRRATSSYLTSNASAFPNPRKAPPVCDPSPPGRAPFMVAPSTPEKGTGSGRSQSYASSTEASAALIALLDPDHVAAAAIINHLPMGLAVTIFGQLSQLPRVSMSSTGMSAVLPLQQDAMFAQEILPYLTGHVRRHLSRAEELRKTRGVIAALRGMRTKSAEEWKYSVERSMKLRDLQRTMEWLLAEMGVMLEELKHFRGKPNRALVGLVAGLCVIALGDVGAHDLRAYAVESGDEDFPAFNLPCDPMELSTLWTKLAKLITVESSGASSLQSPNRLTPEVGAKSPGAVGDGGSARSTPIHMRPMGAGSPFRDRVSLTQSMATLQEQVVIHGLDAAGAGKFFPWVDRLVHEELIGVDAIERAAGPGTPVEALVLWLKGVLVIQDQHLQHSAFLTWQAREAAATADRVARMTAKVAGEVLMPEVSPDIKTEEMPGDEHDVAEGEPPASDVEVSSDSNSAEAQGENV